MHACNLYSVNIVNVRRRLCLLVQLQFNVIQSAKL